jgi:hypothetical protein
MGKSIGESHAKLVGDNLEIIAKFASLLDQFQVYVAEQDRKWEQHASK